MKMVGMADDSTHFEPKFIKLHFVWIFWSVFPPWRPPKPWPFKSEVEDHTIYSSFTNDLVLLNFWTCKVCVFQVCGNDVNLEPKNQRLQTRVPRILAWHELVTFAYFCIQKILLHVETLTASRGHMFLCIMCCVKRWSWIYLSFLFHSMA